MLAFLTLVKIADRYNYFRITDNIQIAKMSVCYIGDLAFSLSATVTYWYAKKQDYNFEDGTCSDECRHYTQVRMTRHNNLT